MNSNTPKINIKYSGGLGTAVVVIAILAVTVLPWLVGAGVLLIEIAELFR